MARPCAARSTVLRARSPPHVVTAFAADARMSIGQVATTRKESEIIVGHTLVRRIDLNGTLVTGNPLHCQGGTTRLITQCGGDWLFTLTANWPVQHVDMQDLFADPPSCPHSEQTTTDAAIGRLEAHRPVVSHDVSWMLSD